MFRKLIISMVIGCFLVVPSQVNSTAGNGSKGLAGNAGLFAVQEESAAAETPTPARARLDEFSFFVIEKAEESGKFNRREMRRLKRTLRSRSGREHIRSIVVQDLVLSGQVAERITENGTFDFDSINWERANLDIDPDVLREILEIILDFIRGLMELFPTTIGFAGDASPTVVSMNESERAAFQFVQEFGAELHAAVVVARNGYVADGDLAALNESLANGMVNAYTSSRDRFVEFSKTKFDGANEREITSALDFYISGLSAYRK